jgi:hypothetical protein
MNTNGYLLSDLPITNDPAALINAIEYCNGILTELAPHMLVDCATFGVSDQMGVTEATKQLEIGFTSSSFVRFLVEQIRTEGSMRFGAVTSLVHDHCRDVPTPYRSDVKQAVKNMYNWLCYYFEDLSWDVPGARSQVIHSNRGDSRID